MLQMDNMFTPNHWESFCSEFGKNVNCVGVMVEGELEKDIRKREERNFMIHKCRIPASRVFNETYHHTGIEEAVRRLQAWSRPELVNFMIALCNDMEAGGMWGELLLHGVPEAERDSEKVSSCASELMGQFKQSLFFRLASENLFSSWTMREI